MIFEVLRAANARAGRYWQAPLRIIAGIAAMVAVIAGGHDFT
jgi:hypothetical protein